MNPLIGDANVTHERRRSRSTTRFRPKYAAGCRADCWSTAATPTSRRYGSALDSLHFERYCAGATNVPHSFKFNGYYESPVRPRQALRHQHATGLLDAVAGGWSVERRPGGCRCRRSSIDNAALVGHDARRAAERIPLQNRCRQRRPMMPDDIILNTQRALRHQRDVADRLRLARRARGPLHPARQLARLRPRPPRRLRRTRRTSS